MKVGDIAQQTGVPTRMIRYYEDQELLNPEREINSCRRYSAEDAARVRAIRQHIAAGLPTRLIGIIFEMDEHSWTGTCSLDFTEENRTEMSTIEDRLYLLENSRESPHASQ